MTSTTLENININQGLIVLGVQRRLANHTSLIQAVRHILTMAYRGLLKVRHTPEQLGDVVFQPIVFTLLFTFLFGGAISGNVHDYLPIIIPGVLAQSILSGSIAIGVQLREDMDKGVSDRFRSLPIARIAPLAGALVADMIRYAIITVITFVVAYCIGFRPAAGLLGVAEASLFIILFAWCLSWVFAFFGVIARTAGSVQGMSLLIMFPLTFLSNAFVPVDTMPGWLKWFATVNPVSHLITAVRQLLGQGIVTQDFWLSVAGALIIVAIFVPVTLRAYMRKS